MVFKKINEINSVFNKILIENNDANSVEGLPKILEKNLKQSFKR